MFVIVRYKDTSTWGSIQIVQSINQTHLIDSPLVLLLAPAFKESIHDYALISTGGGGSKAYMFSRRTSRCISGTLTPNNNPKSADRIN